MTPLGEEKYSPRKERFLNGIEELHENATALQE
jgi:hypothetical protein